MAATIAHTADLGTMGTAEHKYWKTLGQRLLAPILFAAARDDRTMVEVLRWVDLREDNEVAKLLATATSTGPSPPGKPARAAPTRPATRRWPQANIGLVTGELADVLDVDGRPGRMALRRLAADHDLRLEGPLAETGIGWHLYLAPTGSGTTELGISMPATAGAVPAVGPVCQRVRW
jgi:Bifunctional DNA primase/polymerase, N-terminal